MVILQQLKAQRAEGFLLSLPPPSPWEDFHCHPFKRLNRPNPDGWPPRVRRHICFNIRHRYVPAKIKKKKEHCGFSAQRDRNYQKLDFGGQNWINWISRSRRRRRSRMARSLCAAPACSMWDEMTGCRWSLFFYRWRVHFLGARIRICDPLGIADPRRSWWWTFWSDFVLLNCEDGCCKER